MNVNVSPIPTIPKPQSNTLLLIDGSSYLYRAFHALPDLRSPDGFPTGAIHGMVAMIKRLRDQVPAEHAACVFDAKGPTFRDAWYPAYKANRSPMPVDLVSQVEPIHEVVQHLGWPVLMVPGIEADDVIGTLARVAVAAGFEVVISTGDKDLAQLVNPSVKLINTMSNETLDVHGVLAKFGVLPERIIDYLTLMGDAVDNVPGVEKCGPKTAAKWINEYGSLDGVIAAAPGIKGVVGEKLRQALDWLPMGRRLVTVDLGCDLAAHIAGWPGLDALAFKAPDEDHLLQFYQRFNFRTWQRELQTQPERGHTRDLFDQAGAPAPSEQVPVALSASVSASVSAPVSAPTPNMPAPLAQTRYETVLTRQALAHWVAKVQGAAVTALDTETDSLDPMQARLVGLSLSTEPGEAAYIPLTHDGPGAPEQLPLSDVLAALGPWLEDPLAAKIGQNFKFDLHIFQNAGVQVAGFVHDTALQSYVLEAHKPHGLQNLAQRHLGRHGLSFEDVCGKGAQQIRFNQVDLDRAALYACEDADMTRHLHQTLHPQLHREKGLDFIYAQLEVPASRVLQRMERTGVLINPALLMAQSGELGEKMVALEREAHALAAQPFNLGSPKQIAEILFGQQKLPVLKKTAGGAPSTDEGVLEKLALDYPLPAKILAYRSLAKLKSTYTDKLPLMINPQTGRVHTHYDQVVAVTGRLASNDPNLQNIPIRTPEGRRVREAFIAPPGHWLMSADYSQIELRIMAHLSDDANLLAAFAQGLDVHRATASEIFGLPAQAVSTEQRRYAKVINFGLIYGMSAFGLAANLGIERSAASRYIERYFERYPGVKNYMDRTREQAKAQGYVETVWGRRLWLPEINSPNGPRRAGAERAQRTGPPTGW